MSDPTAQRTLPRLLLASAERFGDAPAVIDGDVTLSFRQLRDAAFEVARAAIAHGIARHDLIGIWAPNSVRWIVASLGLHCAGATVVPVNTRFRGDEARDILARVRAKVVLVEDGFLGFDYAAAALTPGDDPERNAALRDLLVIDLTGPSAPDAGRLSDDGRGSSRSQDRFAGRLATGDDGRGSSRSQDRFAGRLATGWADFMAGASSVSAEAAYDRAAEVDPSDLSEVIFTSGTTGRAKGVTLPHGTSLDLYADYGRIWGLRPGDRYLVQLPLFHTAGNKAGMITSIMHGLTIVPMAVFDPVEAMRLIERHGVSVMNGSPTVFYSLLESPKRRDFDLSSLRVAATGAAVVPVALVERARTELPFRHFITAYGMTECCGTATMCRAGDSADVIANTNGRALPGIELRVVDLEGRDLQTGEQGQVLIRGANVTPGYWEDPVATADAIDADGWLHSGDIGTLDAEGNLKITDRLKDIFFVGGFNVSPAEVEQVLARHPAIAEVAVIGVPDERLGEVPRGYAVPRLDAAPATSEEIIAWARERLANFKVPRVVEFVTTLPRNASGKVLKGELRAATHDRPAP